MVEHHARNVEWTVNPLTEATDFPKNSEHLEEVINKPHSGSSESLWSILKEPESSGYRLTEFVTSASKRTYEWLA